MSDRGIISLAGATIDVSDIERLGRWLETNPRLTKGEVTLEFERKWADAVGRRYAVYVNSGSSANLLMLYALQASGKLEAGRIAVPAISWATDLAPVLQLGLEPVLVDANLANLAVDLDHLEQVFHERQPDALMLVSVLGLPPHMNEISSLCDEYNVVLLEDTCESLGSRYSSKLLGTFGLMSTYSLYFGHHLSTIEGGMIATDDADLHDMLVMLRSHGWDRDLPSEKQASLRSRWSVDDFNALYTFYVPGFNLRATDLQAFIGLGQLERLPEVVKARSANFALYLQELADLPWAPQTRSNDVVSNFAFPVLHPDREKAVAALQEQGIETRPLICGSMGMQPFYVERFGQQQCANAALIDAQGFYLPNHHQLTVEDVRLVAATVADAVS